MLIETDVLLAAVNPKDPARVSALKVLNHEALSLSPYSLLEVNLLARAGKLEIKEFGNFTNDLSALFDSCSIRTLHDRPKYHSEARRLESEFRLSFFGSFHAAVSKVEREIIVSFDRAYDKLGREGVKRLDPTEV